MNLGVWGEKEACRYLHHCGYEIVERNFRCKTGEIDIIAQKAAILCFIEVKTRRCLDYGMPAEAVTKRKQQHIRKTAWYYLLSRDTVSVEFRIDVIEIILSREKIYIRHIENAFS